MVPPSDPLDRFRPVVACLRSCLVRRSRSAVPRQSCRYPPLRPVAAVPCPRPVPIRRAAVPADRPVAVELVPEAPGPGGGPPINPAPPVSPAPPVNPTPPGPQPPTFPAPPVSPTGGGGGGCACTGGTAPGHPPGRGALHGDQPDDSPLEWGIRLGRSRLHRSHGHHNGNEYHGRQRRHTEPADRPIQRDWRWPRRNRRCRRQPDHREVILAAAGHESSRERTRCPRPGRDDARRRSRTMLPPLSFATGGCNSLGGNCVINPTARHRLPGGFPTGGRPLLYRPRPVVFQRKLRIRRPRSASTGATPSTGRFNSRYPIRRSSPARASRSTTQA